jgi:uncharacterized protein (TIGR02722 family)
MNTKILKTALAILPLAATLTAAGCGSDKEYVRGSRDPSIDNPAMSTSLDKEDIKRALKELLDKMRVSKVMEQWRLDRGQDTVAVWRFQNSTSEHIDSMLDAMLEETERWLLNSSVVRIVDHSRQLAMIQQVEGSQHPVFDRAHVPAYGKQLGVKYVITGDVRGADERTEDSRRVQYMLYMKVIEVETDELKWDEKAEITKAVR